MTPPNDVRNTAVGRGLAISVSTSGLLLGCAVGLWLVLLLALFLWPVLTNSPTLGMDLIQSTVRLSLLYYAFALNLMLWLRPTDWRDQGPTVRLARCCWSLGWKGSGPFGVDAEPTSPSLYRSTCFLV